MGFSVYQLTNSNKLINKTIYGPSVFGRQNISIFDINVKPASINQIYVLDYNSGLYSFNFDNGILSMKDPKLILDQKDCYAMDAKGYEYLVLNCRL